MKILLGTPASNGQVCADYHTSVLNTLLFFKSEYPAIEFESKTISMSLLPRARNILASIVLNDDMYTHLLFIDSDMMFWPELIANMLAFNEPVVAAIYPKRKFNYEDYLRYGSAVGDPVLARVLAADYIGGGNDLVTTTGPRGGRTCEIRDGFVRARSAGTGMMLIARDVFRKIKDRYPELWVPHPRMESAGLRGGLLQCFDPIDLKNRDGLVVGEDFAFCRRWVDGCGGEIWANIDQPIVHIGQEGYAGKYLHKLEQMAAEQRMATERTAHALAT